MQPQSQPHKSHAGHVFHYVAGALGGTVLLFLALIAGFYLWLNSDSGHAYLLGRLQAYVDRTVHGRVEVGRLSGSLIEGPRFENVVVRDPSGQALLSAPSVSVRYSPRNLVSGRATIDGLSVRAPRISIVIDRQGHTNVESFFSPRTEQAKTGPRREVLIRRVRADGGIVTISSPGTRPIEFENVSVDGALRLGDEARAEVDSLSARWRFSEEALGLRGRGRFRWGGGRIAGTELDVTFGQSHIRGAISYLSGQPGRFSLEVHSLLLMPPEARQLGIGLKPTGPIAARGRLSGPFDRLSVSLHLQPVNGDVDLSGRFGLSGRPDMDLHFDVRTLELGTVFRDLGDVHVAGVCELAGRVHPGGFQGTVYVRDASIKIETLPLTNASAEAQWTGRTLALSRYHFNIPGANVTGTGRATLSGSALLVFTVHVDDPDDLEKNAPLWKTLVLDIVTPVVIPLSYVNLIGGEYRRAPGQPGHLSLYPVIPAAHSIAKPFKKVYKGLRKILPF